MDNPFRYRWYCYDTETGLYYLNQRYYNPQWGRFINADSLIGVTGKLLSHNMFAYCNNNPINLTDTNGNWPSWNAIGNFFKKVAKKAVDIAVHTIASLNPASSAIRTLHYNRNLLNTDLPATKKEAAAAGYKDVAQSENKFHQFSSPTKTNRKMVSSNGHKEVIYNSDKNAATIVEDPRDAGTYNFCYGDSLIKKGIHGIVDVAPYMIWGNSPDDTTTLVDRVIVIFE